MDLSSNFWDFEVNCLQVTSSCLNFCGIKVSTIGATTTIRWHKELFFSFKNQNFISLLYISSKSVEQYFGLAGWQTRQTGRSVETKEVLTFNSSFLNKSLTWSFLVVSSPKWGVRSLCGEGTKYYSSPVEHIGLVGFCTAKIKWGWISTVPLCSARLCSNIWCPNHTTNEHPTLGYSLLKSVNSNFTLAVHSPKLGQAKTQVLSHHNAC